jgi:hypothetical protein
MIINKISKLGYIAQYKMNFTIILFQEGFNFIYEVFPKYVAYNNCVNSALYIRNIKHYTCMHIM